jgi:hypothetical protein
MSTPFYDLASLVVVPSGYKSGKIYAQKPLTTDGQLTFTRASTATRVNASGLIETVSSGVPRLDYQGSTCPKLLLEPQRTNYVRNNTTLTDWLETEPTDTISTAAGTSPDGTNNAIKLIPSTASAAHLFYDAFTSQQTGGSFVMSCYAKADGLTKFGLRESQQAGYYATFDLSTGTVIEDDASTTASIVSMGNGWYRCIAVVSATLQACIGLSPLPASYTTGNPLAYSYAGNGTDGVLIYQPQLEVSSTYATSPISTAGVASATRLADAASKTGISSLIGQTEGVIFMDFDLDALDPNPDYSQTINLSDGTTSNRMGFARAPSLGVHIYVVSGSASQFTFNTTQTTGRFKLALAYKLNDYAIYLNGVSVYTNTSATVPSSMSRLDLNNLLNSFHTQMEMRQTLLFKTRLTNAQLAELTTL